MYIINNSNLLDGTTTDSGINGKFFEMEIKRFFNCKATVASAKKIDLYKYVNGKKCKFEIKTASTEIAVLNENGEFVTSVLRNDFVIYRATLTSPIFVIDAREFYDLVTSNNFTRVKVSTEMNKAKQNNSAWYYDRLTLKTIDDKTSHKARDRMNALLEQNALTLEQFITLNEIKTA